MAATTTKNKDRGFRLCLGCNKLFAGLTACPRCSANLVLVDQTFFLNKTFGKYHLKKLLGMGGMGIVFQGLHKTLNKKVAIKIFIPNMTDSTFEKRFLREARILAELKHPNIIEIYDFDISAWDTPYYVMEYLEGKTLREEIERYPDGMQPKSVVEYLEQIVPCLWYAHGKKIIHRDLKPENIIIETIQGRKVLKILDFGIAKSFLAGMETATLTQTKVVLGSPYYLSPEQIISKNIGPHTDQYALALVVYEMLTGKMARKGRSVGEIMYQDAHQPVRPKDLDFSRIPKSIGHALVKATMPEPGERFPDIQTFGNTILNALKGKEKIKTTITSTRGELPRKKKRVVSIEEEVRREAWRKRMKKILIGILVLLVIAVVAYLSIS
jgi:serine/threonine protein kinase